MIVMVRYNHMVCAWSTSRAMKTQRDTVMPKKTYRIEVTPLDIQKAERNNSYKCVLAQAIQRTIPEADRIMIDLQTIRFSLEGYRFQYLTGPQEADYVVSFDAGDQLKPFSFNLRKPRVTRKKATRVDPTAPEAKKGSPEYRAKIPKRHPAATVDLVGSDGSVTKEEVLPAYRRAPRVFHGWGRARAYGRRILRINKDRFAAESSSSSAPQSSPSA